jgi:hypothetical protein
MRKKTKIQKLWSCNPKSYGNQIRDMLNYDFYQSQKKKHLANLDKLTDGTNLKLQLTNGYNW